MKTLNFGILILCIIALSSSRVQGQDELKISGYDTLKVIVEYLPTDLEEIGLSTERVQNKVELMAQSVGLKLRNPEDYSDKHLYVRINGISRAFSVDIYFNREVAFFAGDDFNSLITRYASTWNNGTIGTHGGDASYVMDAVEQYVEEFLNAYLKANS